MFSDPAFKTITIQTLVPFESLILFANKYIFFNAEVAEAFLFNPKEERINLVIAENQTV